MAPIDDEQKRIDPEDGKAYTFAELSAFYKGTYKKPALTAYWEELKPVKTKGKGKGKGKGKCTRERETGDVDGSSTAAASRGQRLFFPSAEAVRVKDFKMHPHRPPTATLCTEGWSLQASVPDGNLSADDIGKVFTIGLDVRFEKELSNSVTHGFTAVVHHRDTMTCVSCDPCSQNFAALDCVCLVFHRPCTQEVLLVHDWTDAAKTLRKRIDDFILDDEFVLQERFGNAKKEVMEVMSGLNVQDFSSFEVNILAKLADQTAYETWLGRRAIFSARQVTDFNRLKENAEIAKLMKLFQEESQRRPFARSLPYQLPGKQLAAERKVDKEHKVDLPACLEACFQKHFASRALLQRSSEARAPAGLACVNPSGTWCRRLFHVTVPESMVEQGVVAGLRPSERPATWVRVRDLHKHLDHEDAFPTASAVERLVGGIPDFSLSWVPPTGCSATEEASQAAAQPHSRGRAVPTRPDGGRSTSQPEAQPDVPDGGRLQPGGEGRLHDVRLRVCEVRLHDVRFAQGSVADKFRDGRSLYQTTGDLRSGAARVEDFPRMRVVVATGPTGQRLLYTLDNRRLDCFQKAFPPTSSPDRTILVEICSLDDPTVRKEFEAKFTAGTAVQRRQGRGSGNSPNSPNFPIWV